MNIRKTILLTISLLIASIPVYSVTKDEMEKAKVIAVQAYLRYANNGSGYLDEINATSLADLEKKLKKKELENLKAIKAINIPSDFASWDKEKLLTYWSSTFLNSPGLIGEGKAAKARIKARIGALTISAPSPNTAQSEKAENKEVSEAKTENATTPAQQEEEEFLANQALATDSAANTLTDNIEMVEKPKKNDSSLWIYIVILVALVGIVLWLVIFASKTLGKDQKNAPQSSNSTSEEIDRLEEKYNAALISKNNELRSMSAKLEKLEATNTDLQLKNSNLEKELTDTQLRLSQVLSSAQIAKTASESSTKPVKNRTASRTIFLGRVNNKGIFVRADRDFNPSHDVYRLTTHDGLTGYFEVVEDSDLADLISVSAPTLLGNGCDGIDLDTIDSNTRIETASPGIAVFENGYWKVSKKAQIDVA